MKKIMLAFVLSCAMVLGIVAAVSADNGPHGNFSATTDACANCHRAHSAQVGSNSLLITASAEALCTSCHDGTGASTDVENGIYHSGVSAAPNGGEGTPNASLFGGGFLNTLMATAWSGATTANPAFNAISRPATSTHSLGVQGIVYGSGAINSTQATMSIECTSCHDPHGNAGYQMVANTTNGTWSLATAGTPAANIKVPTYRLLRYQPQGSGGFTPPTTTPTAQNWTGGAFLTTLGTGAVSGWTVPDTVAANGSEWYTIGTTSAFAVGDYNANNATNTYNPSADLAGRPNYILSASNVSYFCAQCHDRYLANTNLRNDTDVSAYCGAPTAGVVAGNITLPVAADVDGVAPWIHPTDPVRCVPNVNPTTGALTNWGDNGSTGDTVHKYMHSSGDVLRVNADGTKLPGSATTSVAVAMTAPTSVGRTCVACHVAHGTSAQMTTAAAAANATGGSSSVLLRMDNRSLCLRCHASNVGFTVAP